MTNDSQSGRPRCPQCCGEQAPPAWTQCTQLHRATYIPRDALNMRVNICIPSSSTHIYTPYMCTHTQRERERERHTQSMILGQSFAKETRHLHQTHGFMFSRRAALLAQHACSTHQTQDMPLPWLVLLWAHAWVPVDEHHTVVSIRSDTRVFQTACIVIMPFVSCMYRTEWKLSWLSTVCPIFVQVMCPKACAPQTSSKQSVNMQIPATNKRTTSV